MQESAKCDMFSVNIVAKGGVGGLEHKVQDSRSSDYGMSQDQAQAMAVNFQ